MWPSISTYPSFASNHEKSWTKFWSPDKSVSQSSRGTHKKYKFQAISFFLLRSWWVRRYGLEIACHMARRAIQSRSILFEIPCTCSGGLRFGGGPVQNIWRVPFLCGARKNLPALSTRKCWESDMFRVHQYTKWCQCLNLTFRCTRHTFSVQTWHGLVKQFRCSDGTGNVLRQLIHKLDLDQRL